MKTLVTVDLIQAADQQLTIKYVNGDASFPLAAETIDQLIAALASMRENMLPPVRQADPQPGEKVQAIVDPRFWVSPEPFVGGALIQFRHPGLGWLPFVLPLQSLRVAHELVGNALAVVESLDQGKSLN